MDRLEHLRQVIDDIVRRNPDIEESRCGIVHLYGVSTICALLALKRGMDPELCLAAGMLHDIWNYKVEDTPQHGPLGATESEKMLKELGDFSPKEIERICTAIAHHSDKASIDGELDELLKDADVLQHYLYNPAMYLPEAARQNPNPAQSMRIRRLDRVLGELGIPISSSAGKTGNLPGRGQEPA